MRLQNTSRYPTEEVRALVEFGMRGVNTSRLQVNVKNATCAYRGRAYRGVPRCSPAAKLAMVDYLITLGIGTADCFPHHNWYSRKLKRVPEQQIHTWQEALVRVAAHEARHLYQYQHGKPCSEVDCEKFAAARLEEWRAAQNATQQKAAA